MLEPRPQDLERERLSRIRVGSSYPSRRWEPAGRCGCGNCRFVNKLDETRRTCPQKDSPDAITLWTSSPR